jgi:hypothetical protein
MKLFDVVTENEFTRIRELAPVAGAPAPSGAPLAGAPAAPQQDPQMQQKMMAQQALDRQKAKQELTTAIKQKQEEIAASQKQLQDMQKQLATMK